MIIIKWKKKITNVHEPTSQSCGFCHVVWRKGYVLIISTAPPPTWHTILFFSMTEEWSTVLNGVKDRLRTDSLCLCLSHPPTLCLSVSALTSHLSPGTGDWTLSTELHPSPLIYSVKADLTMALLPLSNWGRTGHCEDSKGPLLTLWLWIRW